jgi:hypothetical protein
LTPEDRKKGAFVEGNDQWKKREKRRLITNALEREIVQFEDDKRGVKQGEAASKIAKNIVEMALDGDKWAVEFIADRTEGKPQQTSKVDVEHSGAIEHRGLPEIGERVRELLGSGTDRDSPALLPH